MRAPDPITQVFTGQYPALVRLAAFLLDDAHAAEDVVQEAYLRAMAGRHRLRDSDKALAYLRQTVVNLSRTSIRRRALARRHSVTVLPEIDSAEGSAIANFERQAVVVALRALPRRHREALILRYYLELTVDQAAQALGISAGAVKAYTSRGLKQLAERIEGEPSR